MRHGHRSDSTAVDELATALESADSNTRLQAAMAAGMRPRHVQLDVLFEQCAIESDFYVRDMLTWAILQHDREAAINRLIPELRSSVAQARSQALHTASKIGDARLWPEISTDHLLDEDDEVARTAWRTAVGLVPDDQASALARTLATQLGRGRRDVHLSLSRALAALGDETTEVLAEATRSTDPTVREHAIATERLIQDPDSDFDAALEYAKRTVALQGAPAVPPDLDPHRLSRRCNPLGAKLQ